jgi:hypothetical protein
MRNRIKTSTGIAGLLAVTILVLCGNVASVCAQPVDPARLSTLEDVKALLESLGYDTSDGFVELEEAELFLEENATDGDLGLHMKVDGEGWKRIVLLSPAVKLLLDVRVRGNLGHEIGLTELFSESAEPSFEEFPREDFLALFPPGTYLFLGQSLEGPWLVGSPVLTHTMPDEPQIIFPVEDAEIDPDQNLLAQWFPVPDPGALSQIEYYEVVVEKDEDDERLRVFRVDMLPSDTSVLVPASFFEPGRDYKVEIIAQETSGNRTAAEVPFATAD